MATNESLSLLSCKIAIPEMTTVAERDAHLANTCWKVANAMAGEQVDLVVLPELPSVEYLRATFECLDALAEPLDGPSFQCWRRIAMEYGCHVSYSFAREESNQFYITVVVVNPDGILVDHYDKNHLAQFGASMEKEYFTRGQGVFVFDVKGFRRVAPLICYGIRIPELSRTLTVDHHADLILHCGAYARDESFAT